MFFQLNVFLNQFLTCVEYYSLSIQLQKLLFFRHNWKLEIYRVWQVGQLRGQKKKINSLLFVRKTPAHQNNGCNNAMMLTNCLLLLNDTVICTISMSRHPSVPVPDWDNRGWEILWDENYNTGCSEWGN